MLDTLEKVPGQYLCPKLRSPLFQNSHSRGEVIDARAREKHVIVHYTVTIIFLVRASITSPREWEF